MYTIKQAAARTRVPVPLLRAWERRYGVVQPRRTASGYRLYDEDAIDRLRAMRALVDSGWSPSAAAAAILAGERPIVFRDEADPATGGAGSDANDLRNAFVEAAIALEPAAVEAALDAMFARGSFEVVADELVLPALVAMGEAWADGRLTVAGEHAASHAVLRRLAAAFQAAGRPSAASGAILVGLPPGSRHELGALAFAVAARRAGLPVLYLGPDLPIADWVGAAKRADAAGAVIAAPTEADAEPAVLVGRSLASSDPALALAFGGRSAETAAKLIGSGGGPKAVALPSSIRSAVDVLGGVVRASAPPADTAGGAV
jgi:methanogenic corrinoid protein MtbC1